MVTNDELFLAIILKCDCEPFFQLIAQLVVRKCLCILNLFVICLLFYVCQPYLSIYWLLVCDCVNFLIQIQLRSPGRYHMVQLPCIPKVLTNTRVKINFKRGEIRS